SMRIHRRLPNTRGKHRDRREPELQQPVEHQHHFLLANMPRIFQLRITRQNFHTPPPLEETPTMHKRPSRHSEGVARPEGIAASEPPGRECAPRARNPGAPEAPASGG